MFLIVRRFTLKILTRKLSHYYVFIISLPTLEFLLDVWNHFVLFIVIAVKAYLSLTIFDSILSQSAVLRDRSFTLDSYEPWWSSTLSHGSQGVQRLYSWEPADSINYCCRRYLISSSDLDLSHRDRPSIFKNQIIFRISTISFDFLQLLYLVRLL